MKSVVNISTMRTVGLLKPSDRLGGYQLASSLEISFRDNGSDIGVIEAPLSEREALKNGGVTLEELVQVLDQNGARVMNPVRRKRSPSYSFYD